MNRLKKIRESKGFSQAKLAEISGVNVRMIQSYEQGLKDINKAQAMTVYKLAKALESNIESLLDLTADGHRKEKNMKMQINKKQVKSATS